VPPRARRKHLSKHGRARNRRHGMVLVGRVHLPLPVAQHLVESVCSSVQKVGALGTHRATFGLQESLAQHGRAAGHVGRGGCCGVRVHTRPRYRDVERGRGWQRRRCGRRLGHGRARARGHLGARATRYSRCPRLWSSATRCTRTRDSTNSR